MLRRVLVAVESRRVRIVLLSLAVFWGAVLGPLASQPERARSLQTFIDDRLKPAVVAIDPWSVWKAVSDELFACEAAPPPERVRCPSLFKVILRVPGALWQAALDIRHAEDL